MNPRSMPLFTLFTAAALLLTALTCSQNLLDPQSGTETVNEKTICIKRPDGTTPVANARISLLPDNAADSSGLVVYHTNDTGAVTIQRKDLLRDTLWSAMITPPGDEALAAWQYRVRIDTAIIGLTDDTLEQAGSVSGFIALQPQHRHQLAAVSVQILGTTRMVNTDSTGRFTFVRIPRGLFTLQCVPGQSLYEYSAFSFELDRRSGNDSIMGDTIALPYTGIPVITGLTASFDSLTGIVSLQWSTIDTTDYHNHDYVILRGPAGALYLDTLGSTPDARWTDTLYAPIASGKRLAFSDLTPTGLCYQVSVRNGAGRIGETFERQTITAVSPLVRKSRTTARAIDPLTLRELYGTALGDSLRITGTSANNWHPVQTVRLIDTASADTVGKFEAHASADSLSWSITIRSDSVSTRTLRVETCDGAGLRLWSDTTLVTLTGWAHASDSSRSISLTLADLTPARNTRITIVRDNDSLPVVSAVADSQGRFSVPLLPDGRYSFHASSWAGNDSVVALQSDVSISPVQSALTSDTLYIPGSVIGTIGLSIEGLYALNLAHVTMNTAGRTIHPDSTGRFMFGYVPAGLHSFTVSMPGTPFSNRTIELTVTPPGPTFIADTIRLSYEGIPPVYGFSGRYDTTGGTQTLRWQASTHAPATGYLLTRISGADTLRMELSISDTTWTDSLFPALSTINSLDVRWLNRLDLNYQIALMTGQNQNGPPSPRIQIQRRPSHAILSLVSFEKNLQMDSQPALWEFVIWDPMNTLSITRSLLPDGSGRDSSGGCLYIDTHDSLTHARWWLPLSGLVAGRHYQVTCWVKSRDIVPDTASDERGVALSVVPNPEADQYGTVIFDPAPFSELWHPLTLTFQAQLSTAELWCNLGHFSNLTSGKAWFDDIMIELLE